MIDLIVYVQIEQSETDPTSFGRDYELNYHDVPDSNYSRFLEVLNETPGFELWEHGYGDNQFFHKELGLLVTVDYEQDYSEPREVDPKEVIDQLLRVFSKPLPKSNVRRRLWST